MPRLVLASTSPYRRALLERLGLPFTVEKPDYDESKHKGGGLAPDVLALRLAEGKARAVAARHKDAAVLGSDQLVDVDGEILGKPGDPEKAYLQLKRLQGRNHRLLTAVALVQPSGELETALDVHILSMRRLSEAELRAYVAADSPLDCAGSYKIERLGIALFTGMKGKDFTAIEGLPLISVCDLLARAGIPVLSRPAGAR